MKILPWLLSWLDDDVTIGFRSKYKGAEYG